MSPRHLYLVKALLLGGAYGLLLGHMTGMVFPAGLGLGLLLGALVGYGQSWHLPLKQAAESPERPERLAVGAEDQLGMPLHGQQLLTFNRLDDAVWSDRYRP